jgi:hypothetical protein
MEFLMLVMVFLTTTDNLRMQQERKEDAITFVKINSHINSLGLKYSNHGG